MLLFFFSFFFFLIEHSKQQNNLDLVQPQSSETAPTSATAHLAARIAA